MTRRIGILGGGAWGTGVAVLARRAGRAVMLWAREADVVSAINDRHENPDFLPGVALDPEIRAVADPAEALAADAVLLAVPAQFVRALLAPLAAAWPERTPVVICAKGIERETGALMSEVVAEALPGVPLGVLSGPSFAIEVARALPTAVTVAAGDETVHRAVAEAIGTPTFRIYATDDVVGAEIGGAVKNVIAVGCGIVEGRGLGDNARAALITRGLAEIVRLAAAKGARPETLMGLAGLGDLILTCNAMQSRNFSFGVALGAGRPLADILGERRSVAEGVHSAEAVVALAARLGVEMPIAAAVDRVLNAGADIDAEIAGLLARPFRVEGD